MKRKWEVVGVPLTLPVAVEKNSQSAYLLFYLFLCLVNEFISLTKPFHFSASGNF